MTATQPSIESIIADLEDFPEEIILLKVEVDKYFVIFPDGNGDPVGPMFLLGFKNEQDAKLFRTQCNFLLGINTTVILEEAKNIAYRKELDGIVLWISSGNYKYLWLK